MTTQTYRRASSSSIREHIQALSAQKSTSVNGVEYEYGTVTIVSGVNQESHSTTVYSSTV